MYTILLLTPDNSGRYVHNTGRDYVHCFIGVQGLDYYSLGGFIPDELGGNPYRYMQHIQLLAKQFPQYSNLNIDNVETISVYGMTSGSTEHHNTLTVGRRLNRLQA